MISFLRGTLLQQQPPALVIDVNGVGYEVLVSMNTLYQLPSMGEQVALHIHFVVREDAQLLYGFYHPLERTLFRQLIKVNGVGPKMALTILSNITPDQLMTTVQRQDTTSLVRLPGVGKKTAERLVIEMRDKLEAVIQSDEQTPTLSNMADFSANNAAQDAISALVALGYKPQHASQAIKQLNSESLSCEQLIRQALTALNA